MLARVLGQFITQAICTMPDPAGATEEEICVELDAAWAGRECSSHETVNHSKGEYSRGAVTTNIAESSFALLKRSLHGTFHAVSEQRLQRYATEFDFRWNTRQKPGFDDVQRTNAALQNIVSKRLTYLRIDA